LKKIYLTVLLACSLSLSFSSTTIAEDYQTEIEYIDSKMPESQRQLVHQYAEEYCISEELLQALIFCESSYQMSAVNESSGCYGLAQVNPNVHGYSYDTEEKQIQKACEILTEHLKETSDIAYALAAFNGQSNAYSDYLNGTNTEDEFVSKVFRIAYDLEVLHGKHDYEKGEVYEEP